MISAYTYSRLQESPGDYQNNTPYATPDDIATDEAIDGDAQIIFELWQPGFVIAECTVAELRTARQNWIAYKAASKQAHEAWLAVMDRFYATDASDDEFVEPLPYFDD